MRLKTSLEKHLPAFTAALFICQPIMDIISFWFQEWGVSSLPTLVMRFGVLGLTLLLGFLLSDRKWIYYTAAGVIAVIGIGHVWACMQAPTGYLQPFADITNYIRVVQMPLTAICLISFLRANPKSFDGMQIGMTVALLIMLTVEVISAATNTDPHTYSDGLGVLGWFNNTNSQSSNLCILVPISLAWQLQHKDRSLTTFCLTAILGCGALFYFGTRLAYLGIYVLCIGLAVSILLVQRKDWKISVFLLALMVAFTAAMPLSPMYKHMHVNETIQTDRQQNINSQLGDNLDDVKQSLDKKANKENEKKDESGKDDTFTEQERDKLIKELTPVYEFYVKDFVEIFGIEKTVEMFDYSIDIYDFCNVRPKKIMFARMLMDDSPVSSNLFGLNLARFTVGDNIYDVENDFHGIYFLFGIVGLTVMLLFMAYFLYLVIWALVKDAKKYYTMEAASYGIALLLCLAHVYNTAGVLRRPNASIFLSAIFAGIYYLVKIKKY